MRMRSIALFVAIIAVCTLGRAQEHSRTADDISKEPHHIVLLVNSSVIVARLKLQPEEVTLPHRHNSFYAYLSLQPVTIANEVRGRTPVIVKAEAGEVHTSKGGFVLAERNKSSQPIDLLIIEAITSQGDGFDTPMGGFRFHDAAFGELFQSPLMRGYTMTIAAGGKIEGHEERYDRLVVAITDLKFQEDVPGQPSSKVEMKAGDVRWFSRGENHAITNIGTLLATYVTFELE